MLYEKKNGWKFFAWVGNGDEKEFQRIANKYQHDNSWHGVLLFANPETQQARVYFKEVQYTQ